MAGWWYTYPSEKYESNVISPTNPIHTIFCHKNLSNGIIVPKTTKQMVTAR